MARASMRAAKADKNSASLAPGKARKAPAASAAAVSAASQSAHALVGYSSGSLTPVAGFSAKNVPVDLAGRHLPPIKTG